MGILFISILTLVLILISVFLVLIVLMQKTGQSGGMGAALGGGAAESAFGSETNTVLTTATIYGIVAFFVVALTLFLFYQAQVGERDTVVDPSALVEGAVVEEEMEEAANFAAEVLSEESEVVEDADPTIVDADSAEVAVPEGGEVPEPAPAN